MNKYVFIVMLLCSISQLANAQNTDCKPRVLHVFQSVLIDGDPFFFNDTATTEIYTLSLHDALPICKRLVRHRRFPGGKHDVTNDRNRCRDRKSTRLNSSHLGISYAVFCLNKKK